MIENRSDQINRRQRSRETAAIAKMMNDAETLEKIENYETASMFALEKFAKLGDALAQKEIQKRRNS